MISKYLRIVVGTTMVVTGVFYAPGAQAQSCTTPSASTCDPCGNFQQLIGFANSSILDLDDGIKGFVNLLAPDVADLDGAFVIDDTGDSLFATLQGDDMRDVSNQMELLQLIMTSNPTGLPFTGTELKAAFQANETEIRAKLGEEVLGILLIAPFVVPALTWLTMLGKDSDFAIIESEDPIKTNGQGTLGILRALLVLLSNVEISGNPLSFADTTVNPGDFITFGDYLAPDADLDNDGFSNICEYRHFRKNLCSSAFANKAPNDNADFTYPQAAIDATKVPVPGGCYRLVNQEDDCTFALTAAAVVPPSASEASGSFRVRRFENDVTGAERYQINYFHTVESAKPVAQFRKGVVGQASGDILLNIPLANPIWWEYYLTAETVATLKANSNYFSVFTNDGNPPVLIEQLRGDNVCGIIAPPPPVAHDADLNKNFIIELSEILPIVEFMNAGGFGCGPNFTYVPGSSDFSCEFHNSDYNPQDWKITLPELLRLVQLYTAGAYEECIGGSEDGYCITVN